MDARDYARLPDDALLALLETPMESLPPGAGDEFLNRIEHLRPHLRRICSNPAAWGRVGQTSLAPLHAFRLLAAAADARPDPELSAAAAHAVEFDLHQSAQAPLPLAPGEQGREAWKRLRAIAEDRRHEIDVRLAAIEALARAAVTRDTGTTLDLLRDLILDPDDFTDIRAAAADALRPFERPQDRAALDEDLGAAPTPPDASVHRIVTAAVALRLALRPDAPRIPARSPIALGRYLSALPGRALASWIPGDITVFLGLVLRGDVALHNSERARLIPEIAASLTALHQFLQAGPRLARTLAWLDANRPHLEALLAPDPPSDEEEAWVDDEKGYGGPDPE